MARRGGEAIGKEARHVLEAEAVVAAVPRAAVAAPVLDPKQRRAQQPWILEGIPQPPFVGARGAGPGGRILLVHHLDEIGVALSRRESREIGDAGSLLQERHMGEIGERGRDRKRLVFPLRRVAEARGIGHSEVDRACRHPKHARLIGHGERGMMATGCGACEASDDVPRIDGVVPLDEREFLDDLPLAGLRLEGEDERVPAAVVLGVDVGPFRPRHLAMRRMLFMAELIPVTTEREAEPIPAQRREHRRRQILQALVLPGADVIRLDRLPRIPQERHRRHLPADFRHREAHLRALENPRRLGVDRFHLRRLGGIGGDRGRQAEDREDPGKRAKRHRGRLLRKNRTKEVSRSICRALRRGPGASPARRGRRRSSAGRRSPPG